MTGQDAPKFLNGQCTSDIFKWATEPSSHGAFAAFLSPQGRLMYDSFIFKHPDGFLLDCDERVAGDFTFHLKQYKLRSKVTIEDVSSSWSVIAEWNQRPSIRENSIPDQRCDWNMNRTCIPSSNAKGLASDTSVYDTLRMTKGIPEGPVEMVRGKAIPMEFNLDLMGAVDLHKGCYLGQELVTRTLHRGVVRKRIVPIELFEDSQSSRGEFEPDPTRTFEGLQSEADLMMVEPLDAANIKQVTLIDPKKSFGKIVSVLGNVGLALVRLEEVPAGGMFAVHRPHLTPGTLTFVLGRVHIPNWWPANTKMSPKL